MCAGKEPSAVLQTSFAMQGVADLAVTGVTHDGAFRVIVVRTTETVREAIRTQAVSGSNASNLADVVTGTILVRLTMAPNYRVQGIVRGAAHKGTLLGDSSPDGTTRSLVQRPGGLKEISLGPGALMQMMRTMHSGEVSTGVVEVPADGVSGALMSYFQSSEQIECVAAVASMFASDAVTAAGGYVVQLLPEVSRAPLAVMTERLAADFADRARVLDTIGRDPAALLSQILAELPYVETQRHELRFGCHCSSVRVLSSLATLPKADIRELMESDEQLSISCDYCGQNYELSPKALAGLLSES
jgi:molecular chaperone Hsp33